MNILLTVARYIRALGLLYLCLYFGKWLVHLLSLPLPDSIIGMLVLFLALTLRIFPEEWLAPACQLLLNYMALLFIPVSVGVMQYYPQVATALIPIVVACVISSLLVLLVVAFGMEYFERKTFADKENHDVA